MRSAKSPPRFSVRGASPSVLEIVPGNPPVSAFLTQGAWLRGQPATLTITGENLEAVQYMRMGKCESAFMTTGLAAAAGDGVAFRARKRRQGGNVTLSVELVANSWLDTDTTVSPPPGARYYIELNHSAPPEKPIPPPPAGTGGGVAPGAVPAPGGVQPIPGGPQPAPPTAGGPGGIRPPSGGAPGGFPGGGLNPPGPGGGVPLPQPGGAGGLSPGGGRPGGAKPGRMPSEEDIERGELYHARLEQWEKDYKEWQQSFVRVPGSIRVKSPGIPRDGFFATGNPKLIVLIHGATGRPDAPPPWEPANAPVIGSLRHARSYWGFQFVRALLGGSGTLYEFGGASRTSSTWLRGLPADPETAVGVDTHFIASHRLAPNALSQASACILHRDGSQSLVAQGSFTINQLYELYTKTRHITWEREPQIIIVAHSMGGLVSRLILSTPDGMGLSGRDGGRADYIRNRVLYLVTLSTPHEGSPLAVISPQIHQRISRAANIVQKMIDATGVDASASDGIDDALRMLGGNEDCIHNLTPAYLRSVNTHPQKMQVNRARRRQDNSLVPIYVIGARTPADRYLNTPVRPLGTLVPRAFTDDNFAKTMGLVALDTLVSFTPGYSWGTSHDARLDRIARMTIGELCTQAKDAYLADKPTARQVLDKIEDLVSWILSTLLGLDPKDYDPPMPTYLDQRWTADWNERDRVMSWTGTGQRASDGEYDNDGMVGMGSAMGRGLGFDHKNGGSWYRLVSNVGWDPWDLCNHETVKESAGVAAELRRRLIGRPDVGPIPRTDGLSVYLVTTPFIAVTAQSASSTARPAHAAQDVTISKRFRLPAAPTRSYSTSFDMRQAGRIVVVAKWQGKTELSLRLDALLGRSYRTVDKVAGKSPLRLERAVTARDVARNSKWGVTISSGRKSAGADGTLTITHPGSTR